MAVFGTTFAFAQPVIAVEDWDFGQCLVDSAREKGIRIINQGDQPLTITGIDNPGVHVFGIKAGSLPTIPFTIDPYQEHTLIVTFTPDAEESYTDWFVFHSNADGTDPRCKLTGTGVQPGLVVTATHWDRLRVDLGEEREGEIELYSTGSVPVRVMTIGKGNADFTVINPEMAIGDVVPGGKRTVRVKFHPKDIGSISHQIAFTSTAGDRIATLSGTGTYAQITTQNYDFGMVDIPGGTPATRDVEFVVTDDVYSEAIEVIGFQMMEGDDGFFSYDIANKLFREDGTQVTAFPFIVPKGGKLILRDVTFAPITEGVHTRSMRILTVDDMHPHSTNNTPVVSVWNGESRIATGLGTMDQATDWGMYPNPASTGEPVQLTYELRKSGEVCITVTDLLGRPVYLWQGARSSDDQHHTVPGTLQAGCYTVTISADGVSIARSMMVIK